MWYGVSSIFVRFLNYGLTPLLTGVLVTSGYGEMSKVYAAIPFLNVIFTYGLETAFFRYSQKEQFPGQVYDNLIISILFSTAFLGGAMIAFKNPIAHLLRVEKHPEYITWVAWIIMLDTLSTLPFAKLRLDNRPIKYAFIRVAGILVNIGLLVIFYYVCPKLQKQGTMSPLLLIYSSDKESQVGYVFIANLAMSALTFFLLIKEFFQFKWKFNWPLWRDIIIYSLPITIAGFGGMINETFDRIMLSWWAPVTTEKAADVLVGIYSANYKLSILITLFIQAFRLGAEPFFFKQAQGENPQRVYARVMKFFVLTICFMFLFVALYLEIWKHFVTNPEMWVGLKVVPILLFANMFLGIYYNLAIWYKLSNNTMSGAYITLIGAGITLIINYLFIPHYGMMACAWATCICYSSMMVISFIWGQRVYPVPYPWKKLLAYMAIVLIFFWIHQGIISLTQSKVVYFTTATLLLGAFGAFVVRVEKKEFRRYPILLKVPILGKLLA